MSLAVRAADRPAAAQPPSRSAPLEPRAPFSEVLGERSAAVPPAATPRVRTESGPAPVRPSLAPFRRTLVGLVEGERRLERLVEATRRGRSFTIQELIGIQALVLRHVQEMEVVSRVLDRAMGTIKTTLQTQV